MDEELASTLAEAGSVADELTAVAERVLASGPGSTLVTAALRRFEWAVAVCEKGADGVQHLTEGVIDAAAFDDTAWQVLDWKTDDVEAATWTARLAAYEAQVKSYAAIVSQLRGEPAAGKVVRTA
jgi:ATP-dependent exoDNAse (exonuclease V) beta subunit